MERVIGKPLGGSRRVSAPLEDVGVAQARRRVDMGFYDDPRLIEALFQKPKFIKDVLGLVA